MVLFNNVLYMHINFIIAIKMISPLKPYQIMKGENAFFVKAARNNPLFCETRNISITFEKGKICPFS